MKESEQPHNNAGSAHGIPAISSEIVVAHHFWYWISYMHLRRYKYFNKQSMHHSSHLSHFQVNIGKYWCLLREEVLIPAERTSTGTC